MIILSILSGSGLSVHGIRLSEEFQDLTKAAPLGNIVKKKASCGRSHHLLGRKRTAEDCALAVEAFGGKFFTFGRSYNPWKKCFVQYAESEACPEGWKKSTWYDFYSIPSVDAAVAKESTTGGARLVKEGHYCNSEQTRIGKFSTLGKCARTAAAAGGKYFNYDRRWPGTGNCYHVYTLAATCPQGFKKGSYDFYELPSVPPGDAIGSIVEDVRIEVTSATKKDEVQERVVNEAEYKSQSFVVGHKNGRTARNHFLRRDTYCNQEFRVGVHAGEVVVETWEACCNVKWSIKAPCDAGADRKLKKRNELSKRGKSWKACGNQEKDMLFEGRAPGLQPTVQSDTSGVVCVKVVAATDRRMLWDQVNGCSSFRKAWMKGTTSVSKGIGNFLRFFVPNKSRKKRSTLDKKTFGKFSRTMYDIVETEARRFTGGNDKAKDRMARFVPTETKLLDRLSSYTFTGMATEEIDRDRQQETFTPKVACSVDLLRNTPRDTVAFYDQRNSWSKPLSEDCPDQKEACTKKEFMEGLFYNFSNGDGDSVYPKPEVDARGKWLVEGAWQDEADKYLGFSKWMAHRVEASDRAGFDYMLRSNDFGALLVKPGFGRVGADMYFDSTGLPSLVVTPDGDEIPRGDPKWQYWKFVWRSSMMIKVTLVDNIWGTHMVAANTLAAASREALPADHALRRLLSLFTFHTIEENSRHFPELHAPDGLLDRALPFVSFHQATRVSMAALRSLEEQFGFLLHKETVESTTMPYTQDAPVLFTHLHSLVRRWFDLYDEDAQWCSEGHGKGTLVSSDISFFLQRVETWSIYAQRFGESDAQFLGLRDESGEYQCEGVVNWLALMAFHVTGFRSQVSQVSNEVLDPDLAAYAWAEGEAFARPRQALDAALLVASRFSKRWPTLAEDYSFIAEGLDKVGRARMVLQTFQSDMVNLKTTVEKANRGRAVKYETMHPDKVFITSG